MRKFLLASVAALGTGGLIGTAVAQQPVVGAPTQGQQAFPPAGSPPTAANNNNNYQAPALPGAVANPTPGTIVIHVNGRCTGQLQAEWGSADTRPASIRVFDIGRNCEISDRSFTQRGTGLATIYRRGRVYWVRFRANGLMSAGRRVPTTRMKQ